MAAVVGQKRQVVGERRDANEEIEVTDQHARSSEPSAFPAKACGNVGIYSQHCHATQKISEVLPITVWITRVKNSLVGLAAAAVSKPTVA